MGVVVMSDGLPVTLDTKLWSLNPETMSPWSATSYVGSDTLDPRAVWRTQRAVRTVVGFLARNVAQVPLHAFGLQVDGDRERLPADRPLSRLLRTPAKTSTAYEAMQTLVVDVCMWERFAAWIVGDGPTLEVVRIPPELWRFRRDRFHRPVTIAIFDEHGDAQEHPLDQFLWLDGYPVGPERDSSPMQYLQALLTEEAESANYRTELWRGGARMPGWIERPPDAPDWSKTARTNFRTSWQEFASGGARAGRTPILEDGMQYHEITNAITPETAQQLESRKFSLAEVAAAFFVPPVFVGLLDNANYSNVTAYREILYADTLGTWFTQIQQAHNSRLLTHPAVQAGDGEFVEFNVAEKLKMSFDEQAKIFQTTTGAPIMTRNEARRRLNLKALPGADELVVPLNVLEGGQASPTDSAPGSSAGGGGASTSTAAARSLSVAEVVQKVYLGVGKVITADEARQIINDAGGHLNTPGPEFAPGGA